MSPAAAQPPGGGRRARRRTAAALRYDLHEDNAPRVVASGQGAYAEQIVEVAREHHVPIHADPQLAELLACLDVGAYIPDELYLIVAEILIFVHEMDKGFDPRAAKWQASPELRDEPLTPIPARPPHTASQPDP